MSHSYTIAQLAEMVGGVLQGNGEAVMTGVADVEEAGPNEITWVTNPKYGKKLLTSRAGAVLVDAKFSSAAIPAILCPRVDRSVAKLLAAFAEPVSLPDLGIHPSAVVHASAQLDPTVAVGPHAVIDQGVRIAARTFIHSGVFIGRECVIGEDCLIWPNAVVRDRCRIGNRVILHSNAVIGADGLGFYFAEGRHNKFPHIGGVVLEDDVEIGACSCVDRSKFGNTIVGKGTKIDNLVQIGHNVRIGEHCVLAGLSGIAGSVRIGRYCLFGGKSALSDHLSVGEGARLGINSVSTKDIPAGATVSGFPAQDHRQELRMQAALRKVPELRDQVRELMARMERLEASMHH